LKRWGRGQMSGTGNLTFEGINGALGFAETVAMHE
jgi:hypothetical protein